MPCIVLHCISSHALHLATCLRGKCRIEALILFIIQSLKVGLVFQLMTQPLKMSTVPQAMMVSTAFIQFTRLSYFWSVLPETAGEFLLHFCLKLRARLKGHLFTDSRKILWFTLVSLYSAPISTCQDELVQKEQWYSVEIDIACFGISLHSGYFYLAGKCYSNS